MPISTTMRTPGHDIELVHGLLHAEGIITGPDDVIAARYCAGVDSAGQNTYNVLDVALTDPTAAAELIAPRAFVTSSACGVCGTSSIEALQQVTRYPLPDRAAVRSAAHQRPARRVARQQQAFRRPAACMPRRWSPPTADRRVREDVGRHNAMDKVIGSALLADELPITGQALLTSSRASFELVQKAVMAGVGMLVAVSAPSSLAVQLAVETGLTLVGFTSSRGFNIYAGGTVAGIRHVRVYRPRCPSRSINPRHWARPSRRYLIPMAVRYQPTGQPAPDGYDPPAHPRCVRRSEHEVSFHRHRRPRPGGRHHSRGRRMRHFGEGRRRSTPPPPRASWRALRPHRRARVPTSPGHDRGRRT